MRRHIVVLGSLNMDFLARAPHLPVPGETVMGEGFQMLPGGKGANQANAAARLALQPSTVKMAGRVGYDAFADHLRASLAASGVDTAFVHATRGAPTGIAMIWLDAAGQNSILVASGANLCVDERGVEGLRPLYRTAACALFQLETPLAAVKHAMRIAKEEGALTILDPAPAQRLPRDLLELTDFLTPNESEARILTGLNAPPAETEQALLRAGARGVVLKLGAAGCFSGGKLVPGFPVKAIDTTAAGDTFNGALAVALAENRNTADALRFANAAAALSVTKLGAQTSAPSRAEVDAYCSFLAP
ncbi:MAG: ribokinase [Acidobacteria bacterium]|nr:ribokinase [Acidobacteriota bacterium]